MRRGRISNNSADNSKISGSASGRIADTLLYGKERKSAVDLEIWKIKEALIDFATQMKNGEKWKEKKHKEKKKERIENRRS